MVIGVTGGSGCGKTTAVSCLRDKGVYIIDCDHVYYRLLNDNKYMIEELRVNFPLAFVDGKIDRKRLGSCALANDQEVILLNAITHKYIISKIKSLLVAHKDSDIAIDGFNLCEGELAEICDCLVGVISPKNLRIDRITIRDKISTDYALKRIDAQPSDEYYRSKCDYILENNGDLSGFLDKCNLLFTKILEG